jgi:hypothetical protein
LIGSKVTFVPVSENQTTFCFLTTARASAASFMVQVQFTAQGATTMKKLLQILILTALLATTLSTATPAMADGSDPWPDLPTCIGCK